MPFKIIASSEVLKCQFAPEKSESGYPQLQRLIQILEDKTPPQRYLLEACEQIKKIVATQNSLIVEAPLVFKLSSRLIYHMKSDWVKQEELFRDASYVTILWCFSTKNINFEQSYYDHFEALGHSLTAYKGPYQERALYWMSHFFSLLSDREPVLKAIEDFLNSKKTTRFSQTCAIPGLIKAMIMDPIEFVYSACIFHSIIDYFGDQEVPSEQNRVLGNLFFSSHNRWPSASTFSLTRVSLGKCLSFIEANPSLRDCVVALLLTLGDQNLKQTLSDGTVDSRKIIAKLKNLKTTDTEYSQRASLVCVLASFLPHSDSKISEYVSALIQVLPELPLERSFQYEFQMAQAIADLPHGVLAEVPNPDRYSILGYFISRNVRQEAPEKEELKKQLVWIGQRKLTPDMIIAIMADALEAQLHAPDLMVKDFVGLADSSYVSQIQRKRIKDSLIKHLGTVSPFLTSDQFCKYFNQSKLSLEQTEIELRKMIDLCSTEKADAHILRLRSSRRAGADFIDQALYLIVTDLGFERVRVSPRLLEGAIEYSLLQINTAPLDYILGDCLDFNQASYNQLKAQLPQICVNWLQKRPSSRSKLITDILLRCFEEVMPAPLLLTAKLCGIVVSDSMVQSMMPTLHRFMPEQPDVLSLQLEWVSQYAPQESAAFSSERWRAIEFLGSSSIEIVLSTSNALRVLVLHTPEFLDHLYQFTRQSINSSDPCKTVVALSQLLTFELSQDQLKNLYSSLKQLNPQKILKEAILSPHVSEDVLRSMARFPVFRAHVLPTLLEFHRNPDPKGSWDTIKGAPHLLRIGCEQWVTDSQKHTEDLLPHLVTLLQTHSQFCHNGSRNLVSGIFIQAFPFEVWRGIEDALSKTLLSERDMSNHDIKLCYDALLLARLDWGKISSKVRTAAWAQLGFSQPQLS